MVGSCHCALACWHIQDDREIAECDQHHTSFAWLCTSGLHSSAGCSLLSSSLLDKTAGCSTCRSPPWAAPQLLCGCMLHSAAVAAPGTNPFGASVKRLPCLQQPDTPVSLLLQVVAGGPFLGISASGAATLKLAGWLVSLCTLLAAATAF